MLAESLSDQFGLALLAGDSGAAEEVAREALELTLGEAMLYDLVVGPAMHRIGQLWAAGEIGVGHEHLATQIATQVLALAHEVAGLAARRAEHRVMLAAVEGEQHVIALDMAAKLLESAGYEVLTLGADVPTHALPAHRRGSRAGAVRALRDHARRGRARAGRGRCDHRCGRPTSASSSAEWASHGAWCLVRGWSWSRRSPAWSRLRTGSCVAPGSTKAMEQGARAH